MPVDAIDPHCPKPWENVVVSKEIEIKYVYILSAMSSPISSTLPWRSTSNLLQHAHLPSPLVLIQLLVRKNLSVVHHLSPPAFLWLPVKGVEALPMS